MLTFSSDADFDENAKVHGKTIRVRVVFVLKLSLEDSSRIFLGRESPRSRAVFVLLQVFRTD